MKKIEIIAEIGQNHDGCLETAKTLIHRAKQAGADVAKFQLYDAKALFPKENNPWYDYNLSTELSQSQLTLLFEECQKVGIEFMASVFDTQRVGWLEALGVARYKIASRSIAEQALVETVLATNKPTLISLGLWKQSTLPFQAFSNAQFLYCISKYPAPIHEVTLTEYDFTKCVGYSDHTIGLTAAIACLARGAKVIEKHVTLDKTRNGPDHCLSADFTELKALCDARDEIEAMFSGMATNQACQAGYNLEEAMAE